MNLIETYVPKSELHAQQLAIAVAESLKKTIQIKDKAVLAVSGGRSPIAFFHALSQQKLAWENVVITLVDERLVATDHSDSNTALVREHLLINQAVKAQFHGLLSDHLLDTQLTDLQRLSRAANQGFLQPDTVILGMGEDAHTASLFPDVADLKAVDNVIAVIPETADYARLSLSLKAILQASSVFVAIGGENKIAVYRQAKSEKNAALPISYVLHQNKTSIKVYYHD